MFRSMQRTSKMAFRGFEKQLAAQLPELWEEPPTMPWEFSELLEEITSTATSTDKRANLLQALREGSSVKIRAGEPRPASSFAP
jgi:hypothetical protein